VLLEPPRCEDLNVRNQDLKWKIGVGEVPMGGLVNGKFGL